MNNTSCADLHKVSEGLCDAAVLCKISREVWDAVVLSLENFTFSS